MASAKQWNGPIVWGLVAFIFFTGTALSQQPSVDRREKIGIDATTVSKLAAALAAALANDEARKRFDAAPFSASTATASLQGDHWRWQSTVGYGKGDLRATVSFKRDGSEPKVEIITLVNEARRERAR